MRFGKKIFLVEKKIIIVTLIALLSSDFCYAQVPLSTQPEKTQTRYGNKEYHQQNFAEAEASYKKALDHKNNMPEATFNLGDAVYEQKRYEDAQKQFQLSAKTNPDPTVKAKAFHNLGNSYLSQKKWEDAITAYKNALKINPADADTKYNLAYANAMLNKNNGGGGENNKEQDKKDQQQNQDQKDQQQKKNEQQKEQDQKQDQQQSNNQDPKNQQQQGQQPKLSKQEAEQLLAAMENEEQKTTQKMQKKQMKAVKVKIKKDW